MKTVAIFERVEIKIKKEGVTRTSTSRTEGEMFLSPQSRSTKLTLKLTLPKLSRHSNLLKITRGFQKLRKLEELAWMKMGSSSY